MTGIGPGSLCSPADSALPSEENLFKMTVEVHESNDTIIITSSHRPHMVTTKTSTISTANDRHGLKENIYIENTKHITYEE